MVKRVLLISVGAFLFLSALYFGAYAYVGDDIPRGASVNGVDIGGLDRDAAVEVLRTKVKLPFKLKVSASGSSVELVTSDAGFVPDYAGAVNSFYSRSPDPLKLIGYLLTGREKNMSVKANADALSSSLDGLRSRVTDAPREGNIIFKNSQPLGVRPINGSDLDIDTLVRDIRANVLDGKTEYTAAIIPVIAKVTWETVQATLNDFAKPAVSAAITINVDGEPVIVTPELIANSLIFAPVNDRLVPEIVTEHLVTDLGSTWDKNVTPPRNASFKTINGKLEVIPSANGRDVPSEKLSGAIISILANAEDRTVDVVTEDIPPKFTTEQALGLDVKDRIGTFTTRFPWTWYRAHNIHRAADILNGTIVQSGGVFSLNQTLGQRTAANGFVEGVVISGGRLAKDFGGGVSQVSTTTYNAAWFAGLKILRHKPHSFYISRYPVGRESTLSWPDVDMRFQNDTDYPIVITTSYVSNRITISIYGTRKYEVETITGPRTNFRGFREYDDNSKTCINQVGIGGFDIQVTRILSQNGIEVRREVYKTRYRSEDRIRCTNPEATFGNR